MVLAHLIACGDGGVGGAAAADVVVEDDAGQQEAADAAEDERLSVSLTLRLEPDGRRLGSSLEGTVQ